MNRPRTTFFRDAETNSLHSRKVAGRGREEEGTNASSIIQKTRSSTFGKGDKLTGKPPRCTLKKGIRGSTGQQIDKKGEMKVGKREEHESLITRGK